MRFASRIDLHVLPVWALAGGLVLYLGLNSSGYDFVLRSQVGIVVWWVVLAGAAWGVLPAARLTRAAWISVGLFGCFVAWTALASTWSLSSERSLQEVSRVVCYLGVLLLAVMSYGDRRIAMRNAIAAVACVVVLVSGLAVLSRLRPGLFPAARTTGALLPDAQGRLSWPLNYWNALATFVALGIPLLLSIATSCRSLATRATAAGAIPLLALCAYLTFSRGGAVETAVAVVVFYALVPDRIPKLVTGLVCAVGSGALIALSTQRRAVEQGLSTASARHEGLTLLGAVVLVCASVVAVEVGIGLAARRRTAPKLQISRRRASTILVVALFAGLILAFSFGAPARLASAWASFKKPDAAALHENAIGRFGTLSGWNRYAYWKVAIAASSGHVLTGSGPGTFQLLWLPRAPLESYVVNAHSLYVETYAEVGLVGLALLVAFFVILIGNTVRRVGVVEPDERTRAAAIAAACTAFLVAAGVDWVWQTPVLPVAVFLLAASVLAPVRRLAATGSKRAAWAMRGGLVVLAVASLAAIGLPLATVNAVSRSQSEAAAGHTTAALAAARAAIRLEPGASSPQLQAALVLEMRGALTSAASAAENATDDEPLNWQPWLVFSRLEEKTRHARAAVSAFRRARSLNPRSPLFNP